MASHKSPVKWGRGILHTSEATTSSFVAIRFSGLSCEWAHGSGVTTISLTYRQNKGRRSALSRSRSHVERATQRRHALADAKEPKLG
jgi:hypothetical protein